MANPANLSQGTDETRVNPTNWNTLVDGINALQNTDRASYHIAATVYRICIPKRAMVLWMPLLLLMLMMFG